MPVTISALSIYDVGSSIYFEAAYSDRTGAPTTPTAVWIELIDVTNAQVLYPKTSFVAPTGPTQEIPVPSVGSAMTKPTQTQTNRLIVTATLSDGSSQVGDFSYQLNNPTLLSSSGAVA